MTVSSPSSIAQALYTMFSAASAFGAGNVSTCSYAILENAAYAALFISYTNLDDAEMTFGTGRERIWDFQIKAFVRDTGDPEATLARTYSCAPTIIQTIEAVQTLQGTCVSVPRITLNRNPEIALNINGTSWLPLEGTVQAKEWS